MKIADHLKLLDEKLDELRREIHGEGDVKGLRERMTMVEMMSETIQTGFDRQERRFQEMHDKQEERFQKISDAQQKEFRDTRRVFIGGVVTIVGALVITGFAGCQLGTLPLPTLIPTEEATADLTQGATRTATEMPTATRTPAGSATPTQIAGLPDVPDSRPNLLDNPGFEGDYKPEIFPEVNVAPGWNAWYCDPPWTDWKCPAARQNTGNPYGLEMGRPEFGPSNVEGRVRSGLSQKWFCQFRTCFAGVEQTVSVTPGAVCEVEAYVQSWSTRYGHLTSDLLTEDDRSNSTWFILVDRTPDETDPPALDLLVRPNTWLLDPYELQPDILTSRGFSHGDGIYDEFALISYRFRATGPQVRVYFADLRLFPFGNNDSYIEDAAVRCIGGEEEPASTPGPQPTPTQVPTPGPRPYDPLVDVYDPPRIYTPDGSQYIRADHTTSSLAIGGLVAGQPISAYAGWRAPNSDIWLCLDETWKWVENEEFYLYNLACERWSAWRYGGVGLGTLGE